MGEKSADAIGDILNNLGYAISEWIRFEPYTCTGSFKPSGDERYELKNFENLNDFQKKNLESLQRITHEGKTLFVVGV